VWGVLAFAGSQGALTALAQTVMPHLRDPMHFDKQQRLTARIAAAGADPDTVVMFGSSRTAYGLRGADLERLITAGTGRPAVVYNVGIPAAGPVTNLVGVRRLFDAGVRPNLVLVELLPAALANAGPGPLEHAFFEPERLSADEAELAISYGFPGAATRQRWRESNVVPAYGLRFPIRGRLLAHWSPWNLRFDFGRGGDETGWSKQVKEDLTAEERRAGVARTRGQYIDLLPHIDVRGPAARALHDTLALCERHGVPAGVVLMPEGTEFRGWYPPAVESSFMDFLGGLGREFGIPVIDAREWVADDDFSDAHHLLTTGARAFTDRLGREYVLPVLASPPEASDHVGR
jgi:hypothetical protein